jgi:hypothetical protein
VLPLPLFLLLARLLLLGRDLLPSVPGRQRNLLQRIKDVRVPTDAFHLRRTR